MDESELLARLGAKAKLIIPGPVRLHRIDVVSGSCGGWVNTHADDLSIAMSSWPIVAFGKSRFDISIYCLRDLIITAPIGSEIVAMVSSFGGDHTIWAAST